MHRPLIACLALALALCLLLSAAGGYAEGVVTPSEPGIETEGWTLIGEDKVAGDLAELVRALAGGEGTIYLSAREPVRLKNMPANLLAALTFAPDPEVFREKDWRVRVTAERPAPDTPQEDVDLASFAGEEDDVLVSLYVWAEKPAPEPTAEPTTEPTAEPTTEPTAEPDEDPTVEPTAEPTEEPIMEPAPEPVVLQVEAEGYTQGEWLGAAPVFTLSGIPEESAYTYAVILFDERLEDIDGETYVPDADGVFTVRFVILDEVGDILSASEQYTLRIDLTAPEVSAMASDAKSYMLVVSAGDSQSGVASVSRDGGATWEAFPEEGMWTYKAAGKETLAAGQLQVRDAAGNTWENAEPIELTAVQKSHGGGGGGSGTKKQHSSNTSGNDGKTGYASAALTAPEEPVESLALKESELTLAAFADGAEGPARFAMAFARWTPVEPDGKTCGAKSLHTGDIKDEDDTLVLTALRLEEVDGEAQVEYVWRFDGALLRTLYVSGVDYLALRLGDDIAVLPTAGFTAGTRFTQLKIAGTSSRRFAYEARMELLTETDAPEERLLPEGNSTEACLFALSVDVEDELYQLFPRDTEEMYAEGVFASLVAAMDYPMGAYPPESEPAAQ